MSPIAKLRLTNFAFMLTVCFTMGSLAAMLITVTTSATDPETGERITTHLFGRQWYQERLFGLIPEQGIIIGIIAMAALASLFTHYHNRTTRQEIEAANQTVSAFLQRHWWKLGLLIIVLALILTELIVYQWSL